MKTLTFACILTVASISYVKCQSQNWKDRFDINAGFSIMERFNVGTRYTIRQSQIGLNIGYGANNGRFGYKFTANSFSGSFYQHFGRTSRFSELKPWYVKPGLTYASFTYQGDTTPWHRYGWCLAKTYIGRDFHFSHRFGSSFALGPLFAYYKVKRTHDGISTSTPSLLFAAGADLSVFYKF
jgi:hypothetical protein